jgi:ADP-heptose:LPS heptosyltransferase
MLTIYRNSDALGDCLMASMFTHILRDHGIAAQFWCPSAEIRALEDCPTADNLDVSPYYFNYSPESQWDGRSIMRKALDNFQHAAKLQQKLSITRTSIPVRYHDIPEIQGVDVSLCTASGHWSRYRDWPYFDALKRELSARNVSWVDLQDKKGIECLNHVKKSRLYVGLETGTSHYVSSVVPKVLILQSGYSNLDYWNHYGYQNVLSIPCRGRNCFRREGCPNNHYCMRQLTVEMVLTAILDSLGVVK